MLHHDKELFSQAIIAASQSLGIDSGIIEKDYYVTMFLRSLVKKQPQIIFKGGTSLSKCHKIIKRFSEDIDLNLECEAHPTEGQRRRLKDSIVSVIDEFGFSLTNAESIRSRRDFNKYIIDFPSVYERVPLKQYLIVETSVFIRSYPSQRMTASCFIYDYIKRAGRDDIIGQFSLEPFDLNVQSVERTFIDKLFAVGDYYLDGHITEHSRHLYDLYKMFSFINIDESLRELLNQVREDRRNHPACHSAQDGVDLRKLLQEVIDRKAYEADYKNITSALLFEDVSYEKAVSSLQAVIDSELLSETD